MQSPLVEFDLTEFDCFIPGAAQIGTQHHLVYLQSRALIWGKISCQAHDDSKLLLCVSRAIFSPHRICRWTNEARFGSSDVCGESDQSLGGCSGFRTWASADAFCRDSGARLCTLPELQADEARATG